MKQEIKDKWLEALRSGKYHQGRNQLKLEDEFCCLGVLCDIAKEQGIGDWQEDVFVSKDGCENSEILPDTVMVWAGLESDCPTVEVCVGRRKLAFLNDHGTTFSEIADLIEKHL